MSFKLVGVVKGFHVPNSKENHTLVAFMQITSQRFSNVLEADLCLLPRFKDGKTYIRSWMSFFSE